jgi:hypothetical protein
MGQVIADSMEAFASVSFLLFTFIMVFTILGLHVFGDLTLETSPNLDFRDFTHASITVFQVR